LLELTLAHRPTFVLYYWWRTAFRTSSAFSHSL